jgi:general stress protein YciG
MHRIATAHLSGALFANYSKEKASEICKKAGTEGGKSCQNKKQNILKHI